MNGGGDVLSFPERILPLTLPLILTFYMQLNMLATLCTHAKGQIIICVNEGKWIKVLTAGVT